VLGYLGPNVQTVMVAALVLSLPLVLRTSALWRTLPQEPRWLFAVPAAWFLRAVQWLLGAREPYFAHLAATALVATGGALAVASATSLTAVPDFVAITMRRSSLHQLVFMCLCAAGAAMAASSVIGAAGGSERWVARAALGAPFTLMAGSVVGLRLALLLTNLRAGWLFRIAEDRTTRRHQLDAVRHALFTFGVGLPTVISMPLLMAQSGVH
jgi:hypothetical protein